jgi:hypothetical protein
MSTSLGNLVVNLEANIARFSADMSRASQQTEQAMNKINSAVNITKAGIASLGVGLSLGVIVSETNKVLDSLAKLDDMAQKTGTSVETLSKLSKVAAFTGTDLGAVDSALVKLAKNLAEADDKGSKTAKALAAIGISTADLKEKDPGQMFVEITNKLQGYRDGAGKVALVTDLMGKSAADLLPYMNDVSENIEKFTADSTKAAAEAAKFQDEMGRMKVKYDEIKTAIVKAALPAANDFIEAIKETNRQARILTENTAVTTWGDDVALIMARMADGGSLVGRTFRAVNAELTATAAHIEMMDSISKNVNPIGAAKVLATGGSPTDNIKAAMAKHDAQVALAYSQISSLWNDPMDKYERAMQSRIAGRSDAAYMAGVDGLAGMAATDSTRDLNYGGSETKPTTGKGGKVAVKMPGLDVAPAIARMRESAPDQRMADRLVQGALNETLAIRGTIDATMDLQKAEQERVNAYLRAMDQNAASVERIRQDLMTDVEHEQVVYESRLEQLRIYGESRIGSEMAVNAMIEQESARHIQTKLDMQNAMQMQMLAMSGGAADQLYDTMKKAGLEQTALAKAVFIASKAIAVAEIIMNTNVAASKAEAQFGAWGVPIATAIRVAGYASAGMTAGLAIDGAREKGGPVWADGTFLVGEKGPELFTPSTSGRIIPNHLLDPTGGGGNRGAVTINYSPQIHIDGDTDMEKNRKMIGEAVARGNADLVDRLQRAGRI